MVKIKKKGNPFLFGLILFGAAIAAIWKNEHRFDYYKAAKATEVVDEVDRLSPDHLFSYTGEMDQSLTLQGHYVKSFQGFLEVRRSAEIYAWDREEDDDGVRWSKEWMSSLQNNSRNKDLSKKLKSGRIHPESYQIDRLSIAQTDIQFVDDQETIAPSSLKLIKAGNQQKLKAANRFFYRSNGGKLENEELGDERLSYHGLPVPETATYFGKWGNNRAVAHQAEVKEGFISDLIGDNGILHHLVAGKRETALQSMKAHLAFVKNITRGIALTMATIGGGILFSSLTRFLVFIPFVGPLINRISGWLGMFIGFLLGLITLVLAYLTSKPLILVPFLFILAGGLFYLWKNARRKRTRIQETLTQNLGYTPSQNELAELEFIKLWQLMASDGEFTKAEQKQLNQWAKRRRWRQQKITDLSQQAEAELAQTNPQENLQALISYTLADGHIDRAEMKSLEKAAKKIGVFKPHLSMMIAQMQRA